MGGLVSALVDSRHRVYAFASFLIRSVWLALFILFMLLLRFALFRRRRAEVPVVGLVVMVIFSEVSTGPAYQLTAGLAISVILMSVLLRFGLLSTVATIFVAGILRSIPLTLDPEPWYFGRSLFCILVFVAAAGFAFWSALGEKKAIGLAVLEET